MCTYLNEYQQLQAGYDAWLRQEVQASIDDIRSSKSHEEVMVNAQSVLNSLVSDKNQEDYK